MSAPTPEIVPTRTTLYLVDASLYVFRAWHSMPDEFRDADGWPTNAVHGFARFLLELLERERPRHIAIAFDEALDSCFRNALYPAYKANRAPAPEELRRQFRQCKALCAALGLVVLAHSEYEADDLIGSALHAARASGHRGVIVSADKDLSQLLDEFDEQWDYARNQRWGAAGVKARHGVHAHQIADYLALTRRRRRQHSRRARHRRQDRRRAAGAFRQPRRCCSNASTKCRTCASAARRRRRRSCARIANRRCCGAGCRRSRCDAPLHDVRDYTRGTVDAGTLLALCDSVRFGPLTRRRLQRSGGHRVRAGLADRDGAIACTDYHCRREAP